MRKKTNIQTATNPSEPSIKFVKFITAVIKITKEISYYDKLFLRLGQRHIGKEDSEEGLTFGLGSNFYVFGMDIDLNYTYHDFGIFGYMPYFEFIFNF